MIDLYSWPTPNGQKVHIMLEECGLSYAVHAVDIGAGEQFAPKFLKISPNNKIPAIVDSDGPDGKPLSLFESGAILIYLAGKTGSFLPRTTRGRYEALQWLMFQMSGLGPMLGQAYHFRSQAPEQIDYAIERYAKEARRLLGVIERQLAQTGACLAGRDYSIADIACWPWIHAHEQLGLDLGEFPKLGRWHDTIGARAAVQRGMNLLADRRRPAADPKR